MPYHGKIQKHAKLQKNIDISNPIHIIIYRTQLSGCIKELKCKRELIQDYSSQMTNVKLDGLIEFDKFERVI